MMPHFVKKPLIYQNHSSPFTVQKSFVGNNNLDEIERYLNRTTDQKNEFESVDENSVFL